MFGIGRMVNRQLSLVQRNHVIHIFVVFGAMGPSLWSTGGLPRLQIAIYHCIPQENIREEYRHVDCITFSLFVYILICHQHYLDRSRRK